VATRPIIDVEAREHPVAPELPAVPQPRPAPPPDPLRVLQNQLELLRDRHRAIEELMSRMRERVLLPNPDAAELMRVHAQLVDRSIETILSAFSRPFHQDDHDV
jgi:hypothetical protein